VKLVYHNKPHAYYLDGKRCTGVTSCAKIPVNRWSLDSWDRRQIAIGMTLEPSLAETVAMDLTDREAIDGAVETARIAARAHTAAERGTQMHRVLELILTDDEDKLLTAQQREDADMLKRTLDEYRLTPHDGLVEQFALWPDHRIAGRFDAVLETADGRVILVDLKSGPNAVKYPESALVQLALYARAPLISENAPRTGDKQTVEQWREMPKRLDLRYAYVLLAEPGDKTGTLHEMDIEHGWAGAKTALEIMRWRNGPPDRRPIARSIPPENWTAGKTVDEEIERRLMDRIYKCNSMGELRSVWREAKKSGPAAYKCVTAAEARAVELDG
jgi:PD-(D/E)XK nuclease superfamily